MDRFIGASSVSVQFRVKSHLETKQHELENVEGVIKKNQISIIRYDEEQFAGPPASSPTLREIYRLFKYESSLSYYTSLSVTI